jgi:hypothetical protein
MKAKYKKKATNSYVKFIVNLLGKIVIIKKVKEFISTSCCFLNLRKYLFYTLFLLIKGFMGGQPGLL